jgi:sterol desaturase/sphingolipid hydroxylase (fatty acid hydroxylase superfamily)
MFEKRWVRQNKIVVAILIYIILFGVVNLLTPAFMYNPDGSLKEFGVGFRKKTIIPVWLISIFLAILSYFSVVYYTSRT